MSDKEETVKCAICGGGYKDLNPHIIAKHGIKLTEYSKLYPGSKIRNDFCQNILDRKNKTSMLVVHEAWHYKKIKSIKIYEMDPAHCFECKVALPYEQRKGKYCSRHCANSSTNRLRSLSVETKAKIASGVKLNNYLNPEKISEHYVTKTCPICMEQFSIVKCLSHQIYCTQTCYKLDKHCVYRTANRMNMEQRKLFNQYKRGYYKGYWCDSGWELAWIIYNLENNIKFERNRVGFDYEYDGAKRLYYPDFILEDGSYVELKGWSNSQVEAKLKAFPHPIKVIDKYLMKPFLTYVCDKYGKEYWKMLSKTKDI